MKLFFLRHTEAEPGDDDSLRELTDRGRKDARRVGAFLHDAGVRFDAAFASPLVRARQTAEFALKKCPLRRGAKLRIVNALLNGASPAEFQRWLGTLPKRLDTVLLVGHAPSLAEHLARLLALPKSGSCNLPKGGLACVELAANPPAVLRLFITPKLLKK
jgi:phosphohistidine phosphatase